MYMFIHSYVYICKRYYALIELLIIMHMEVDLDINHYDLESLVGLFKIPMQFGEKDLKSAKKIVLSTHPDKSRLDKKYFLFFSKAYKILYEIYQFKHKSTNRKVEEYNTLKYRDLEQERELDKQQIIDKLSKSPGFITTFNSLFEKHYSQQDHGYGDWFSSSDDIHNVTKEDFDSLKTATRAMVVHEEVKGIDSYRGDILGGELGNYGSSQYEDLRHAYTNALVLGVDERDYREGHGSLEALKQARHSQNVDPLTKEEVNRQMEKDRQAEDSIDTSRAYKLIQEQENHKNSAQAVWSSLLRISDNK